MIEKLLFLLSAETIGVGEAIARLILALFLCGIVGFEREARRQSAGLRTHTLIGLGSTLLMILSIWLPQRLAQSGDPARIAAQVVSGIGFLGAGAFIRIGSNVKGLTTAASIWFVAGLGLTIGAGMWSVAIAALLIAIVVLALFEPIERRLFPSESYKSLDIWYDGPLPSRATVEELLKKHSVFMKSFDATLEFDKKESRISMLVKAPQDVDLDALFSELKKTGRTEKIKLEENY
jgi:putative Mg2+ transporter-C (MgtC) family protein